MPLSGDEIRKNLEAFLPRWRDFAGTERSEAQTFLNELLAAYGTDRQAAGARFEERGGTGFIDMLWPGVCIVEMKRPSEKDKLAEHREQAFEYWKRVSRDTGNAGRYVVVCAFHRFEVFEPGAFWDRPVTQFDLADLPDRHEALAFLGGAEPRFVEERAELTREAVGLVTDLYLRLGDRGAEDSETLRDFTLQCVWCMFAEDLGMFAHEKRFMHIVEGLLDDPERSSADDLGRLFDILNTPGPRPQRGLYKGVPYADGGLFAAPARVDLSAEELELLRQAALFDWKQVEPAIFGSLLEGALGRDRQWAFGAHYTSEGEIRKVVEPTVVEPWRDRVEACEALSDVQAALEDLARYVVLDPACGSGNFLYVAYRELRRIEARLRARERELRREAGLSDESHARPYPLSNVMGIELEPFAVKLARVTIWMGHKLAVEELGLDEEALPLADLSGIRRADALKVEWPHANAIVGNPPYHGSQQIRSELGDGYAAWLQREFGIGLKDYAVYWFRKAHQALRDGGRAGLVATNSISQNRNRGPSLQWIADNGGVIVNAVSKQEWPGVAVVNVSIVNWVKRPAASPARFVLDGEEVEGITPALTATGVGVSSAVRLAANRGKAFQGPIPADSGGFILSASEARTLLTRTEANYRDVIRPYLTSDDIGQSPAQEPSRFIIDFGLRPLEDASRYPAAMEIVRKKVRPFRQLNNRKLYRDRWWTFAEPRRELRHAVGPLQRYIAGTRHGARLHFCWCEPWTLASDATNSFAFEDDSAIGVLISSVHHAWARAQSSTIRTDIRYTPTSAFGTFPWPKPTPAQREEIADLARTLVARRQEICRERGIGLTKLYNEVDEGAYRDLAELHRKLDEAVARAYGWPASAAHDPAESNRRLLELNRAIAAGRVAYDPFS